MSEELNAAPTTTFWVVGGAALVWNLLGFYIYYSQVTASPEDLETVYNAAQLAVINATPVWATAAFALAVTAGVLGCALMLIRKSWAALVFLVSLIAILAQDLHIFVLADSAAVFGPQVVVINATVLVIAVALVWYSRFAKAKGWLS